MYDITQTVLTIHVLHCRMLKQWIKRKKRGTKKEENKPRWEADYELVENEGLFQEYLEMSEYGKYNPTLLQLPSYRQNWSS